MMKSIMTLAVLFATVLALGCTIEFGGSSIDFAEVFDAEISDCAVNIQDDDDPAEIVLTGTLTAVKEVDIEWLVAEGFVTIGEAGPESIGTARVEDRLFRPGDAWDFTLSGSKPIEGFVAFDCNVQINGNAR